MLIFLFLMFMQFSLLAVGGANAIVPELHRVVVSELRWMSGQEFAALFALAQAAPGPNVLVVSLVGWKVAGVPGAIAATSHAITMNTPAEAACAPDGARPRSPRAPR